MTPHRLTPRSHSQSATVCIQVRPERATPALLHTTCTAPKRSSAACASASTSAAFDTSVRTSSACRPVAATSPAASLSAPASTSASTTCIPAAAKRSASARPIPLPAPVTTAILSVKSFMCTPQSVESGPYAYAYVYICADDRFFGGCFEAVGHEEFTTKTPRHQAIQPVRLGVLVSWW